MTMEIWWEDTTKDDVSVAEFDVFLKDLFEQRSKVEEKKEELKLENEKLTKMEAKTLSYLKALGRESYKSAFGTVSLTQRLSITLPKTPEAREAFFNHLREKGLFDNMISVNSQTLNSWYKQEYEAAKEEKRLVDFKVPGLTEPIVFETIQVRRAK